MADVRDLLVRIKGDTNDFNKSMRDVKGSTDDGHASFMKLTGAVAAGQFIFAAGAKAAHFLGDQILSTVESAKESEDAISQLNAVLKSTGEAAGLTSQDLQEQATALQKLTTFSDEAIMSAESLLLTFTNVKGAVFQESVPLILDMSQALGQDLKSSSIQLGKALNDPIKGITALSRVGVSFTQTQKDQIKTMVDAGKTADAQRIILAELHKEFGGSAEAAAGTFAGSMARLKNQMDDVKESIGKTVIEGITPLMQSLATFVASDKFGQWMKNVIQWTKDLTKDIKEAIKFYGEHKRVINDIVKVMVVLAGVLLAVNIGLKIQAGLLKVIKDLKMVAELVKWAAQAVATAAVWTAQFAIMSAKAVANFAVQSAKAIASGAIWAAQAVVAGAAWTAQFAIMVAKATPSAVLMALRAADAGVAWVINAAAASFAWVTTELPKIVLSMGITAVQSTISAAKASATWVANAAISSAAWIFTELPKIVLGFITTSAAATAQAGISSAAWIFAASKSAIAWVITELPRIVAAFIVVSGAAIINAAIASGAWVAAAARSSAAWLISMATTTQSFGALSALVATPMVMPAIVIAAALISLDAVYRKGQETLNLLDKINSENEGISNSTNAAQAQIFNLIRNGTPEQKARAKQSAHRLGLPGYATGTDFAQGGLSRVGEQGAEIVDLPRGSRVIPAKQTQDILSGGGGSSANITLNVNVGMYAGMPVERRDIAVALWSDLVKAARAQGVQLPMIGVGGVQ